jgi:hypothetical protein
LANQVTTAPVVANMGLEEEPDDPSFAAAEQSIKIECGCCFDDECSFVSRAHMSNIILTYLISDHDDTVQRWSLVLP